MVLGCWAAYNARAARYAEDNPGQWTVVNCSRTVVDDQGQCLLSARCANRRCEMADGPSARFDVSDPAGSYLADPERPIRSIVDRSAQADEFAKCAAAIGAASRLVEADPTIAGLDDARALNRLLQETMASGYTALRGKGGGEVLGDDERQGRRDNDSREVAQEALAAKLERHRNFLEADLERHPARTHARLRA
ncbi:MAG: hypothetical protein AAGE01_22065, partial [Pseudomonadota bacterium]